MSNITLNDCIAIAAARNEPLEDTIRRIGKLNSYADRNSSPKVAKGTKNVVKPRAVAANAGRATIEPEAGFYSDPSIAAGPAKPKTRKTRSDKGKKRTPKVATIDPKVGNGSAMRMTLRGIEMPTDKLISESRADAIIAKYKPAQIKRAAKKLGFAGKTLRTLSVADGSDLLTTLKG